MKKHYKIFLFVFSVLMLSACTDYSEGPALSLRTTRKKMSATWKVKEAVKFNQEVTPLYKDGFFTFTNAGGYSSIDTKHLIKLPPFSQDTSVVISAQGEWALLDKSHFELIYTYSYNDPYNTNVVYNDEVYEKWEILRLTPDEFWIKNDSCRFKFIRR